MKMYLSTAIFLSLLIIGFAHFCAGIISDNFYPELYPIIDDYFWAKTIMFIVPYFVISAIGFLTVFRKFFNPASLGVKE